jgi:hypothetical protein
MRNFPGTVWQVLGLLALGGGLIWAQEKPSGESKGKAEGTEQKETQGSASGPAAKKEKDAGPVRVTGPDGKTYIVRETPFGTVKVPETPAKVAPEQDENEPPPDLKAREVGDSIQFERMTPFGVSKWTKKKTELTEMERRAWEREQKKGSGGGTAKKEDK